MHNLSIFVNEGKMEDKKQKVKHLFEDKPAEQTENYSKRYAAAVLSVISTVLCILSVVGAVLLNTVFRDSDAVREWINNNYILGFVIMVLLCAVQVVIALIPGEVLEIASGYAFGGVVGAIVCLIGMTIGSVIAILLARKFGRRLVLSFYPQEKVDALPILNDHKKRNVTVFLLFLIPGTPKDLLTYVIGLTNMSIPLYILLTLFARIPSIILSTIGGGALGENKLATAVIMFIICAVVSGCGYLVYLAIQKKHNSKKAK